jgi:zona occludens toxin (predicted ATPase)
MARSKKNGTSITKHFKLVAVVMMALLAIVIIYGWNKAENRKAPSPSAPSSPAPQQQTTSQQPKQAPKPAMTAQGVHPSLPGGSNNEHEVIPKKKGCNVCQAKKMREFAKMQQEQQQNWL